MEIAKVQFSHCSHKLFKKSWSFSFYCITILVPFCQYFTKSKRSGFLFVENFLKWINDNFPQRSFVCIFFLFQRSFRLFANWIFQRSKTWKNVLVKNIFLSLWIFHINNLITVTASFFPLRLPISNPERKKKSKLNNQKCRNLFN